MTPKNQWLTMGAIALVVIAGLNSCGDSSNEDIADSLSAADRAAVEAQAHKDATGSDTPTTTAAGNVAARVDADAIERITREDYPKAFKRLGKAGADEAYKGATVAAWRAIQSPDCAEVETASVTMESTARHMEFFVNCNTPTGSTLTAKQWRFKASELKDKRGHWYTADNVPAAGTSDTDRNIAQQEAARNQAPADYARCEEQIKSQLDYPSAAEFHNLAGRADFVNPQNENVIQIEFEAKNGFGNMLPFTANCIFHHNGKLTTDIFKR
ncbi:TPA: hypothetical protein ACITN2_004667 [Salmonella enterica subsp. enterica serovar Virchow]